MSDVYWERVVALSAQLQQDPGAADPAVDESLVARLTLPRAGEADYVAPPAHVTETTVASADHPVPVRVYRPHARPEAAPMLVWCHGGAFLGGDLDMPEADAVAREIVERTGGVVVSVDYRLCTGGVHYPAPSDDLLEVFAWAVRHASTLGGDPDRISIGGASAGACLAAGAAVRLRDAGGAQPWSVVLAYPVVHPVLPPASPELEEKLSGLPAALAFRPEVIEPVMENFLGGPVADAPAGATPGVSDDLVGLPPTLIMNCDYDGLRASGERYANQLRAAGVHVETHTVPDVAHGHLNRPGLPQAQESLTTMSQWLCAQREPSVKGE